MAQSISQEAGGVSIVFGDSSGKVKIRGPEENVAKAKVELLDLANQQALGGAIVELDIAKKRHRQLIGRAGVHVNKVQEETGVRVIFPNSKAAADEKVLVIGKKEGVEAAQKLLMDKASLLDSLTKDSISIDNKHHRFFIARRAQVS